MENIKFKGQKIKINDVEYVLPPLPVKAFSKCDASNKIKSIQHDLMAMRDNPELSIAAMTAESITNLVSLVTLALQRNYPDITETIVEDGIEDIMTLFNMFQFLISQSDEVKGKMEEARKNALKELVAKADKKK